MNFIKTLFNDIRFNERNWTIFKNIIASFLIKGGALILSLFTMPAYMRYFDNQTVLGLWFTVLSVMSWILTFDLGIGNGLRNHLVEALVNKDSDKAKKLISSAYIIVGAIVVLAFVVGLIVFPHINWNVVFNISSTIVPDRTLLYVVEIVYSSIVLQFLLRLILSILYAMQKSALPNLIALITSAAQLLFVLFAPSHGIEANLIMLSIAYALCVNIPLIIITIKIFKTDLKGCVPVLKYFNKKLAFNILMLGGLFFWVQIMYMLITGTNEIFITQYSETKYVVIYQIYSKLFTLVGMLFTFTLIPMWSAITKAFKENDLRWIRILYKRLNLMALLAVVCEFLLILVLQIIVNIWLGKNAVAVDYNYAIVFALFGSTMIYVGVLSSFACGMGKLKTQSICYTLGVILKFVLTYIGMRIRDSWIVIMVANVLVMLPYCIVQPITLHKDFNNMGIKETQTFNLHSSTIWRTFMGITSLAKYYLKRNPNVIKIVSPIYNHVIGRNHFHIKGKENKISIPNSFLNKSHINIIGSGNEITFGKDCYLINTEIDIRGNNNCIYLGNTVSIKAGKLHIEDSNGQISIGSGTSICGTTLLATIEGRAITIGNDCLFSSDVSFRTGDSHSILDIEGNRINPSQDIFVGNHVWLGNKTILTKGACVADNSVVGTGAIVTKKFTQQNVILAGIPAQILSRNINWDIKCI